MKTPGRPLDVDTRAFFETRLGHDFSDIRVHTDARSAQSAREIRARAYTLGHDIVFGEGRFAPSSRQGRKLLAHELTHVIQQGEQSTSRMQPLATSSIYEHEAHAASEAIDQGRRAPRISQTVARGSLQRDPDPTVPQEGRPDVPKPGRVEAALELLRRAKVHFDSGDADRKHKAHDIVSAVLTFVREITTESNRDRMLRNEGWTRTAAEMIVLAAVDGVTHLESAFRGGYPMSDVTWKEAIGNFTYAQRYLSTLATDSSTAEGKGTAEGKATYTAGKITVVKGSAKHECDAFTSGTGPTPPGRYCLRKQGEAQRWGGFKGTFGRLGGTLFDTPVRQDRSRWYLLEPQFPTTRSKMDLHYGARSEGCITVSDAECFHRLEAVLNQPGTVTQKGYDGYPPGNNAGDNGQEVKVAEHSVECVATLEVR